MDFDLSYSGYDATNKFIDLGQSSEVQTNDGYGRVFAYTANLKYEFNGSRRVKPYLIGGIGGYSRSVSFTQTVLFSGIVCDPWWGYCYPGVVPGDVVVASKSSTDFGWNVGAGLDMQGAYGSEWFIEVRYHQTEGDHQTEFLPVQIGARF